MKNHTELCEALQGLVDFLERYPHPKAVDISGYIDAAYAALDAGSSLPCTIEIAGNQMCVMDAHGETHEACSLRSLRTAKRCLREWQDHYTFHYAAAMNRLSEHFASRG